MAKNLPFTLLDANQTVIESYDEANSAHRVEVVNGETPTSPTNPIFINALPFNWDYFTLTLSNANTTETYDFKIGGAGGDPSGQVVLNYTDSTRDVLTNGSKTAV